MPLIEADQIIAELELKPHPEGGWYKETFRDAAGPGERPRSTAIYFLLKAGERSHWHRLDAVELWHWYSGAPLEHAIGGDSGVRRLVLGPRPDAGQRPQAIVPARAWQSAESLGDFTLVGCTMAPGFEFSGFELAPEGFEPA